MNNVPSIQINDKTVLPTAQWPCLPKIIIKVIGIIVLSFLAFKEFYPLLDEYEHRNSATHVQVTDGKTHQIYVPPVILCIPRSFSLVLTTLEQLSDNPKLRNSTCEICDKMDVHSWNIFKNTTIRNYSRMTNSTLIEVYHDDILVPLMKKIVSNDTEEFSALHLENFSWNELIIHAVWDMLNCVFTYDRQFNFSNIPHMTWCVENRNFFDVLLSDKSKIEKLFHRFVDIVCQHVLYGDLSDEKHAWPKGVCIRSLFNEHSAMFYNNFCFALPLNGTNITATVDAYAQNRYWSILNNFAYYPPRFRPNFDIFSRTGEVFSSNYLRGYYSIYQSSEFAETVTMQYNLPFSVIDNRENIQCYSHVTRSECRNRCVVTKLAKKCKCIPFMFRTYVDLTDSLPYCTTVNYSMCEFDKDKEMVHCDDYYCTNPCQYAPYQWTVSRAPLDVTPQRRMFALIVKRVGSVHVDFHTTKKTSREVLLSQLGAIVNFYLGFSGLTVIAAVLYLINLCKRVVAYRRESILEAEKSERRNTDHSVSSKHSSISIERRNTENSVVSQNKSTDNFLLTVNTRTSTVGIGNEIPSETNRLDNFIKSQDEVNENLKRMLEAIQEELQKDRVAPVRRNTTNCNMEKC